MSVSPLLMASLKTFNGCKPKSLYMYQAPKPPCPGRWVLQTTPEPVRLTKAFGDQQVNPIPIPIHQFNAAMSSYAYQTQAIVPEMLSFLNVTPMTLWDRSPPPIPGHRVSSGLGLLVAKLVSASGSPRPCQDDPHCCDLCSHVDYRRWVFLL